jgi:hypothetical protein
VPTQQQRHGAAAAAGAAASQGSSSSRRAPSKLTCRLLLDCMGELSLAERLTVHTYGLHCVASSCCNISKRRVVRLQASAHAVC